MQSFGIITSISHKPNNWGVYRATKGVVIGYVEAPQVGDHIKAAGKWVDNPKYGRQFEADQIELESTFGRYNMVKCLSNAKLAGWGKAAADKLYTHYSMDMLKALDDSASLKKIGFTSRQVKSAAAYYQTHKAHIETLTLLMKAGVGYKTTEKLIAKTNYKTLLQNPFSLMGKVDRLQFSRVDRVFLASGGDKESVFRLKAALSEVIRKANNEGHTGIHINDWVNRASTLLNIQGDLNIDIDLSDDFIEYPENSGFIYSKECYEQESIIAKRLKQCSKLAALKHAYSGDTYLSDEQKQAIAHAKESGVSIVTGSPGTGKTTVINSLCELAVVNDIEIFMLAPTGLAARRMSESVKDTDVQAMTIHSFLASLKRVKIPKGAMIIIDEASMASTSLLALLLSKLKGQYRVVVVGDVYQLPSIDHGQVLKDLIESGVFPVTRLTKSFRFDDSIGKAANAILHGQMPEFNESVKFLECHESNILDYALQNVNRETQVLSPIKEGNNGTKNLCRAIATRLYPEIKRDGGFGVGDIVINTKNDYSASVFNGERGRIVSIGDKIAVIYESGIVEYDNDNPPIMLAYALTVHKCQGQEYSNVIIVLPNEGKNMMQRQLIYTAVTRSKAGVTIIGSKTSFETVLSNMFEVQRITGLQHHLKSA